jgi:hypothetical protein
MKEGIDSYIDRKVARAIFPIDLRPIIIILMVLEGLRDEIEKLQFEIAFFSILIFWLKFGDYITKPPSILAYKRVKISLPTSLNLKAVVLCKQNI